MATAESVVVELIADVNSYQTRMVEAGRTTERTGNQIVASTGRAGQAFVISTGRAADFAGGLAQAGEAGGALGTGLTLLTGLLTGGVAGAISAVIGLAATFAGKLLDTSAAEKQAERDLRDFANAQVDLGRFIDQTTGKLIAQQRVMAQATAARIPAQITAANVLGQSYIDQGFAAARGLAGRQIRSARTGQVGYTGNSPVGRAVDAAGGNFDRLLRGVSAAAAANPADKALQGLVNTLGALNPKVLESVASIAELKNQGAQLTTVLNGGTIATKASVDAAVRQATATTEVAKAQSHLQDIEEGWPQIDAMNEGAAKSAAVKQYTADMVSATNAVDAAQKAQRAAAKATREVGAEAKRAAKEWEHFDIVVRNAVNGLPALVKRLNIDGPDLSQWKDKGPVDLSFGDMKGEMNDRAETEYQARLAADDKLRDHQRANIESLSSFYQRAFEGGTGSIWDTFKQIGTKVIADLLAKWTIGQVGADGSKLLSGLSSLLGGASINTGAINTAVAGLNVSSGLPAISGPIVGGRASGGYVAPGQTVRVNESAGGMELLRMGSQGGTVIPLGQARAAQGGGSTTVVQTMQFDLSGAVMTADILAQMNAMADAAAVRGAAGGSSMAQTNLTRRAKYRLG